MNNSICRVLPFQNEQGSYELTGIPVPKGVELLILKQLGMYELGICSWVCRSWNNVVLLHTPYPFFLYFMSLPHVIGISTPCNSSVLEKFEIPENERENWMEPACEQLGISDEELLEVQDNPRLSARLTQVADQHHYNFSWPYTGAVTNQRFAPFQKSGGQVFDCVCQSTFSSLPAFIKVLGDEILPCVIRAKFHKVPFRSDFRFTTDRYPLDLTYARAMSCTIVRLEEITLSSSDQRFGEKLLSAIDAFNRFCQNLNKKDDEAYFEILSTTIDQQNFQEKNDL